MKELALVAVLALGPALVSAQTEPLRGKYRVTLNGFTAQRQTYDHFLQIDGKGDEIYFASYVAAIDTGSADLLRHWVVTSRAMGDVAFFPDRVRMGMNSTKGGIRTGDRYPLPTPQQRVGPIARDSLPMLLWEGELIQGRSAVVLSPTVWEWDDNPELYAYWMVSRAAVMQRLIDPEVLLSVLDNHAYFPFDLGTPGFRVQTNMFADPRDRPIGLELGVPATGVGFVEPRYGAGKGPSGSNTSNGGKGSNLASQVGPHSRSIVEVILGIPPGPAGTFAGALFRSADRQASMFTSLIQGLLGSPAPVSRAKGRVDAPVTQLPWSPALSRDVKVLLKQRVDSLSKVSNRTMRPPALLGMGNALRSVIRDYRATDVYFFEKTLVLTPQALEAALNQRTKPGIPRGSIDIVYVDHNPLQGRYILHLQVERLP